MIGRSGFRDLSIRGVLSPQRWVAFNGTTPTSVISSTLDPTTKQTIFNAINGTIRGTNAALPFTPVVIDPLMIAMNLDAAGTGNLATQSASIFPIASRNASVPALPRMSLSAFPGSIQPVTVGAAEYIFRSSDDLVFTTPKGPKSRPMSAFAFLPATNNGASIVPGKRLSNGDISWFATIAADPRQTLGELAFVPQTASIPPVPTVAMGGAASVRQYQITVASCFKRTLAPLSNDITGLTTPPERAADVTFASAGGVSANSTSFSASDAYIAIPNNTLSASDADQYLDVQMDQWIMIVGIGSSWTPRNGQWQPTAQIVMNWYRVVAAGANVDNYADVPGAWSRPVRLEGPNWDSTWTSPTAIIVDGVFGVFQKTVTSDGLSSWSL